MRASPSDERLVLTFHGVGTVPDWVGRGERPYWVHDQLFFQVLDRVRAARARGTRIQITFDDGNASDAETALPALVERGLTADFFICAGRIGESGYLDVGGVLALRDAGMRVGSHGWAHVDWRTVDDHTLNVEVQGAKEHLSKLLGNEVTTVAIPFGSYDRRVLGAVRRAGFDIVLTSDRGRSRGGWLIRRETWVDDWAPDRLEDLTCVRPELRLRARRSIARVVKKWR